MSLSVLSGLPRLHRIAAVVATATVAAVMAPVPAVAGVVGSPTITAPADGATVVSSPMLVSADTTTAYVRFVVAGQIEQTVAASGGSAITEIPVHGLSGPTSVEAYNCDSLVSCGVEVASIEVSVQLKPPTITNPSRNDVVGNSVTVSAKTIWGGALRFFVDGDPVGKVMGVTQRISKDISLKDRKEGQHTLSVQQCSSDGVICDGGTDTVQVIKDTRGPKWSDVSTSLGTVFPAKDHYKDSTRLSARVGEKSLETKVEIRKAGGPVVRTLKLGRVGKGRVAVNWNGRRSSGDIVPSGKYTFRFIGTDVHGIVGKSNEKVVKVSDKKLVKKTATKVVSAVGSFAGNGSGECSDLFHLDYDRARFNWPKGVGYYSNVYCRKGGDTDVAVGVHVSGIVKAPRYGSFSLQAYGAGAYRHAGPAALLTIKGNNGLGATKKLGTSPGWYGVKGLGIDKYLKKGRLRWAVGTSNGNWYDVKEFRIAYTYFVLR